MTAVTPGAVAAGTMTAVVQDEYGTAPEAVLRLAEITRPAIADDEILVRVRAASVDRGTWHLMAGLPYPRSGKCRHLSCCAITDVIRHHSPTTTGCHLRGRRCVGAARFSAIRQLQARGG